MTPQAFNPFAELTSVLAAEFKRLEDEREAQLAHHAQGRANAIADFGWLMHELGLAHPDRVITDTVMTVGDVRFALDVFSGDNADDEYVEHPVFKVKLLDRVKPFNEKTFDLLFEVASEQWGEMQYRLIRAEGLRILNGSKPSVFWPAFKLQVATYLYKSQVLAMNAEGDD